MRTLLAFAAALVWQMAATPAVAPSPQHMQYERAVNVPPGVSGQACAVLDASVFAHAAGESLNDLRLYATATDAPAAGPAVETPFSLTESEAAPADQQQAGLRNLGERNGEIVFDLTMPQRPYTAVVLALNAKNFLATARVSGSDGRRGKSTALGSFTLFDLSAQRLSRSTTLPLQESTFPELHVTLHLIPAPGSSPQVFAPAIVQGASVPPSREAQTLYTTVAATSTITQAGRQSLATITLPAHVPVERVAFVLAPGFHRNFLRTVNITATPGEAAAGAVPGSNAETETVSGEISLVHLPPSEATRAASSASGSLDLASGNLDIDSRNLNIDAALAANLRRPATVVVAIDNGDDPPLSLASVQLRMRQRKICFNASPDTAYTLLYDDPALHAPVYDYARLFVPSANPATATLGPERRNPSFAARVDSRPYSERHPQILWIVLLAVIAALGSVALRSARREKRR